MRKDSEVRRVRWESLRRLGRAFRPCRNAWLQITLASQRDRFRASHRSAAGLGLAIAIVLVLHGAGGANERPPESPFARLFDTGAPSARPLLDGAIASGSGWILLAEDDLTHEFRGDAVLRNDRIVVVLRHSGPGAEVYSLTREGPRRRAVLTVSPTAGGPQARPSGVKILENNPGAATLDASFAVGGGRSLSMKLRLTTGQPILEVRPGPGARQLVVRDEPRYLVVPDFFADDMVFDAESLDRPRLGLPTENLLLHLLADGDAMAMCVWKSRRQDADALIVEGDGRRRLGGCVIQCIEDEPIWIAWMEGRGLWRRCEIPLADPAKETVLDWKPPFPAKWRADFVGSGGVSRSSDFGDGAPTDACCRLENGRAVARVPSTAATSPGNPAVAPIVIYPIDRSRSTPLTALTPTDVVRNTLGVGPCQYILATEGFDPNSTPTPAQTMDWIEKQFQRKKEKEAAEAIGDLLQQMVAHVALAQARIQGYAALADDVRILCRAQGSGDAWSEAAKELDAIAQTLAQIAAAPPVGKDPAARAGRLAGEVVAQIGRDNALPQCERLGASIRQLGADQDRALSKCRMLARWLSQEARTQAVSDPDHARLAAEVRSRIDEVLQTR